MTASAANKSYAGRWIITELEMLDLGDFESDEEPCIVLKAGGKGSIAFACLQAELDWRMEGDHAGFTFSGFEEGDEVCGRGWFRITGSLMTGKLFYHLGEESEFKAKKEGKR